MKKFFSIVLISVIFLSGCSFKNTYDEFEHYSLEEMEYITYTYTDESGVKSVYAVADLTESDKEYLDGGVDGLFYKVGDDDYILIDRISKNGGSGFDTKNTYFCGNTLYIKRGNSISYLEKYTLDKENTFKEELTFNTSNISQNMVGFSYIEKVKENYIFLVGYIYHEEGNVNIKCNLENLVCELA